MEEVFLAVAEAAAEAAAAVETTTLRGAKGKGRTHKQTAQGGGLTSTERMSKFVAIFRSTRKLPAFGLEQGVGYTCL